MFYCGKEKHISAGSSIKAGLYPRDLSPLFTLTFSSYSSFQLSLPLPLCSLLFPSPAVCTPPSLLLHLLYFYFLVSCHPAFLPKSPFLKKSFR